jgi:hypothetical protein
MSKKVPTDQQSQGRCKALFRELERALKSPSLTFREITQIKAQGLYFIAEKGDIIYVGKTGRAGQKRMRELATDFRSHTLNYKLLRQRLRKKGLALTGSVKTIKQEMIAAAFLTEEEFRAHQASINAHIRGKFTFQFYPVANAAQLGRLEYFAIAILDPTYNA